MYMYYWREGRWGEEGRRRGRGDILGGRRERKRWSE